ncbi:hypothetical protein [Seleniivibrio woodruffii]|uniref:Uncharacterized protein n=1 Tax=Seleniivibrio woodruffii TaxID=1078050 RepID=A0A4R1K8V3_9BACT|nr:hypothetical protein [Seleniivibrio woodruffii]TCK60796.1 hypothetical protein C8D98_1675 [Seleniivibrio woodruffii]TVZ36426.1 hypothetical protein OF66_2051 [Seleniivibrio woodruffii]
MKNIEHNNIFELIALDTGLSEDELPTRLRSMGRRSFVEYTSKNGLSLLKNPMSFGSEVTDPTGKILINSGVPVGKYFEALLDRYVNDDRFHTSPIKIECTSDVLNYYRSKSYERVGMILNDFVFTQDKFATFYSKIKENKFDIKAMDVFNRAIDHMLSSPDGIMAMVKLFKNATEKRELITDNINSAFISLVLSPFARHNILTDDSGGFLMKIALTSIMQNIAELMDCGYNPDCIDRSAKIAKSLINDDTVEEAIRMKTYADGDKSVPIFFDQVNRKNFFLRLLVTVNLFVELVKINKTDPANLEVHKSLYELAELGYADREMVSFIGKLFLPAVKSLVLEYAYKIKNSCGADPIIWSTIGDMLPVKFLCPKAECLHTGQHKTFIPEDVKIEADSVYQTRINAGMYHTCKLLTEKLQDYYKTVSQRSED